MGDHISKFKATCRAILDRVAKTGKPVLVTRFGKPVARILPPPSNPAGDWLGSMRDSGKIHEEPGGSGFSSKAGPRVTQIWAPISFRSLRLGTQNLTATPNIPQRSCGCRIDRSGLLIDRHPVVPPGGCQ